MTSDQWHLNHRKKREVRESKMEESEGDKKRGRAREGVQKCIIKIQRLLCRIPTTPYAVIFFTEPP